MEEEAFFGVGWVDAGDAFAFDFGAQDLIGAAFGDPLVVIFGEEGVGGELQAAAAFDAAVAGGAVAGALGEDGADVAGEGEGALGGGAFDGDLGFGLEAVERGFDGGGTVGDGGGAVGLEGGVFGGPFDVGGDVGLGAVGVGGGGEELLAGSGAGEGDGGGDGLELDRFVGGG